MTAISSTAASTSAQSQSLIQSVTGLNVDVNSLVTSLVTAEGQAKYNQINTAETAVSTHLSGLGTLSSALSSFQTSLKTLQTGTVFQTDSATSSNSSILTVTPGSGAVAASHSVEVDQLATAQNSITNAEFANSAAVVGTGSLTFNIGSGSTASTFTVNIDSSNDTLAGIVNAINNATGNTSVSASIINVDSATPGNSTISKLVLNSNNTGTTNSFTVTGTEDASNPGLSQLFSAPQVSTTNTTFDDTTTAVGAGTLNFTDSSGNALFNLSISSPNDSLTDIASAINNANGNNNTVTASVVTNSSGSNLVLTSSEKNFTVAGTEDANNPGLSQLFSSNLTSTGPGLLNQTNAANAIIKVDGQKATTSSNSVSDVLQGVTLGLQSAAVGTTVNVGVSLNTNAINSAVSNFVSAYNSLHTTTQSLGAFGGSGGTNGPLIGDSMLEYASTQVRQLSTAVVSSASGNYNSLAMIGITVNQDGVMSLDSTTLNAALKANMQSVSNVFSSSDGVATLLNNTISNMLQTGGTISTETQTLNSQMTSLQNQATAENQQLDSYKASLQQQFTAMETVVGNYNSTGTFLTNWVKNGG
jgi:flagellar hook-associated protein 2